MWPRKKRHSPYDPASGQQHGRHQPPVSPGYGSATNANSGQSGTRSVIIYNTFNYYTASLALPPSPYMPPHGSNRSPNYSHGHGSQSHGQRRTLTYDPELQFQGIAYGQVELEFNPPSPGRPIQRPIAEPSTSPPPDASLGHSANDGQAHTRRYSASAAVGQDRYGQGHGYEHGRDHARPRRESQSQSQSQFQAQQMLGPHYQGSDMQYHTQDRRASQPQERRASDAHASRSQSHSQWAPSPSQHQYTYACATPYFWVTSSRPWPPPLTAIVERRDSDMSEGRRHNRRRAQSFSPSQPSLQRIARFTIAVDESKRRDIDMARWPSGLRRQLNAQTGPGSSPSVMKPDDSALARAMGSCVQPTSETSSMVHGRYFRSLNVD
ncbi:hypothetical protein EVG20_g645 [Dentipellis fragilis]|uniref:Uncharacterized protein n=1 Tax=Dentipellis fragilis TaxID=205917 RepID=A0A4Y9ZEY0_9AGAM|nr:hypothetical protein EVG20_g645 [Dentipellis fragilis]